MTGRNRGEAGTRGVVTSKLNFMKTSITDPLAIAVLTGFASRKSSSLMLSIGVNYDLCITPRIAFRGCARAVAEPATIVLECFPGISGLPGYAIGVDANGAVYVAIQDERNDFAYALEGADLTEDQSLIISHVLALVEALLVNHSLQPRKLRLLGSADAESQETETGPS